MTPEEHEAQHELARERYDDARNDVVAWAGLLVDARERGEPWSNIGERLATAVREERAASEAWNASVKRRIELIDADTRARFLAALERARREGVQLDPAGVARNAALLGVPLDSLAGVGPTT